MTGTEWKVQYRRGFYNGIKYDTEDEWYTHRAFEHTQDARRELLDFMSQHRPFASKPRDLVSDMFDRGEEVTADDGWTFRVVLATTDDDSGSKYEQEARAAWFPVSSARAAAVARARGFMRARAKMDKTLGGLDRDILVSAGDEDGPHHLLLSDLQVLVAAAERLRQKGSEHG